MLDSFFKRTFRITRRVRQWENNGMLVESSHLLEDGLVKDSADGRETHEDCRLDIVNNLRESLELLSLVIIA